jgi:HPt (histidine-containing phosphotransfer) domain-containing protein
MSTACINWDEAMNQVGGDKSFLDEVLSDLLSEADAAKGEIADGIETADYSMVMKAAHRIKGSASYLCCDNLRDVSFQLQEAGHKGVQDGDASGDIMANIVTLFAQFVDHLNELKAEVSAKM